MVTNTTQVLAERVNTARKLADIPVFRLANATGIPNTTLKRKLSGHADFTVPELQALSLHLGVKFSDWLRNLPRAA